MLFRSGLAVSIYFSFITATSVGFGDVVPIGGARVIAIIEGAGGLLLFGCIISKFVSRRQEELIEEIHRTTFEERLGRVRTNLHLVLSELQSLSIEADDLASAGGAGNGARILQRVESAAMVFSGELRSIHDLLYRPQQTPEETVFEAMLANLAAGLDEFRGLLEKLPQASGYSPALTSTVKTMSRLAGEICGECVPREHAPALKVWMDRIQGIARQLSV